MRPSATAPRHRRWLAALLAVASAITLVTVPFERAAAADASDFEAGYIIDDKLFFDGDALSASQIDAFIAAKNPGCASGRKCIENYRESVTSKAATTYYGCKAITGASNQTAGQIIAKVAVACGISPKAILVILQKEQSLITSTAPSARAFAYAMGAGCPDTAPCDVDYAGFYEQVYYGAKLLKSYTLATSSNYTRYQAGKTSPIYYNPKKSCGTKSVYVRNQATHALYVYTPYTPNSAALSNLYGLGNSCSAYGNRNFWRLYTDWFGSPTIVGAGDVEDLWLAEGGASGWLGAKVGELQQVSAGGGGLIQQFEGGYVVWNKARGAHVIWGAIYNFWKTAGGPSSALGWPLADNVKTTANAGGRYQEFAGGMVVASGVTGTFKVYGNSLKRYKWTEGTDGPLGFPLGNLYRDTLSGLQAQNFEGGTIYLDGTASTWIPVELKARVDAAGGPKGTYGWPSSTPTVYGDSGYTQEFAKATLTWTEADGVRSVFGGVRKAWLAYGGSTGPLGWPTADMTRDAATGAAVQEFQGGTVYALGSKLGWVADAFRAQYAKTGGLTGTYGWPKLGPVEDAASGGGTRQEFDKATLTRVGDGPVFSVFGGMYKAWVLNGGTSGPGWPVTSLYKDAVTGLSAQDFQAGTVYIKGTKSGWVADEFVAAVGAAGGVTGSIGWPTAKPWVSATHGGGVRQDFATSSFTWTEASGTVSVGSAVRAAWTTYGGPKGSLGWPLAGSQRDAKGVLYQDLQGGRIYVQGTKKGWVPTALVGAYADAGGPLGTWGWPTASPTTKAGVTTQVFAKGTATLTGETVTFTAN